MPIHDETPEQAKPEALIIGFDEEVAKNPFAKKP
jgi:hypothetical protein